MANSTLETIRRKVRRLTRSPNVNQLSDTELDEYINTFVLYDFPEHLRLKALLENMTFYTNPYQTKYITDENVLPVTDPLYNFHNKYITIKQPVFVAGYPVYFTQDQTEFYGTFPNINFLVAIGTGDGVTTTYSGTLSATPVIQEQVLFSSIDSSNGGISLYDVPSALPNQTTGTLFDTDTNLPAGTINYVTGVYSLTFPTPPAAGTVINAQTVPYAAGRPTAMLYFNDTFFLRQVPDQPYRVQFEVYRRPTELLSSNQKPELSQWWQYIAYGAAKKVFEDRTDMDGVQHIMPEFEAQQNLVNRRTIEQLASERPATIYDGQINRYGYFNNFNGVF